MQHKGILIGTDNELVIVPRRDSTGKIISGLVIGNTILQDTALVLGMNQGELKEDPLLGPNLIRLIRSQADKVKIERAIKVHLERAGIDYQQVKGNIKLNINRFNLNIK